MDTASARQRRRLIAAVKAGGGALMSRAELAKQLGKVRLNYRDDLMLSELAKEGKIHVEKIERAGAIKFKLVYRSK